MLPRVLEPEVMDTADDAHDYDTMDHSAVNVKFAADLHSFAPQLSGAVLDVGTGTAQIPIQLCRIAPQVSVVAIDAAAEMLKLAERNIVDANLSDRIRVEQIDAKRMAYPDGAFAAVVSNSIIHHIPEPFAVIAEMLRVCGDGGVLFVRDLLRPSTHDTLDHLVKTYAGDANDHQRLLFAESLHAALTLDEIRELVGCLGFAPDTVQQTTDRHWTWAAIK